MREMAETSLLQRQVRQVSIEWSLVKLDCKTTTVHSLWGMVNE